MMRKPLMTAWVAVCFLLATMDDIAFAVPPIVTGDVPTAEKGHVEYFSGMLYKKSGAIERQIPFTELVYGISDRQEITFEMPYLSLKKQDGFGDIVLGTKYQILPEAKRYPGIAGSFEWKLKNGSQIRGLGTGAMDFDFRLRGQKTFGCFTGIGNIGYTFVGEPSLNGVRQARSNVVFLAFAQEWAPWRKTTLLSELYWRNSDEPHAPHRLAADVGFKYHLLPRMLVHAAVGKSLREANRGGPQLRIYAGIKLEF